MPWGLVDPAQILAAGEHGDPAIARIAGQQHGVVTTAQMRFLGLGTSAIAARARQGRLHRIHRGVYIVGHRAAPPLAPFAAAVLACGSTAAISHRSAASIWKLLPVSIELLHVVLPMDGHRRSRPGIEVHRTRRLERWEVRRFQRIPVTAPARTITDLAETEPIDQVRKALNEGRIRRLFSEREICVAVAASAGRQSFGDISALIEEETGGGFSRSAAEDLLAEYVREARFPVPVRNLRVHGFELDFYWPELGLNVEIDGVPWHSTRDRVNRDRARDAQLLAVGIQVLRLTWDQLQQKAETIARLAATIAIARERRGTA